MAVIKAEVEALVERLREQDEKGRMGDDLSRSECSMLVGALEAAWTELATRKELEAGTIKVWPFYRAPAELQARSEHGGDEDWVALVPPALAETYIGWAEGTGFGCAGTSEHVMPDGSVLRIGAHA